MPILSVLAQAWRSWKSAKAVALLAAIALAVGIGSTTAIYTVVNAVMLRPLPYPHSDRFVTLYGASVNKPEERSASTFRDLQEYQQRTHSFEMFGWFRVLSFNLTSPGHPQHIAGAAVTPSLAHNLGVNPILGQWFRDETEAVISNALWKRLGSDPAILGKGITLSGHSYTIAGVMPPAFRMPLPGPGVLDDPYDVWIFLDPRGREQDHQAGGFFLCYARLKPGVTRAQAEADVKQVAAQIAKLNPAAHPGYTARLDDLRESVIETIRPTLLLLLAASGLLLLITCANVAGLLLVRAVARARETAIRIALGAARRQLALQYFIEGLFVSLVGAAAGVLLSIGLVRLVVSIAAEYIPRADEITIDWRVLLFAAAMACFTSILASLAPLWQAAQTSSNEVLNDGVRASARARTRRLSRSLVIGEIALAFTLLAVSAVLLSHLGNLIRIWPGFDTTNLLTFRLTLPDTIAAKGETRVPHQVKLVRALEATPGVTGVAFANQTQLDGCCLSTSIYPEGRPANLDIEERIAFIPINPDYFQTLWIPLRRGRFLTYHDANSKDVVIVVVNEAAARHYWPNEDPIGAYGRLSNPNGDRFQVVGVVGDVRNDGLGKPTVPEIYMLHTGRPVNPMHFLVRSTLPAQTLVPEIRRAIQTIDPTQSIHDIATMGEIVRSSVSLERVGSFMVTFFALAALLMATLGVYGVVSYSVRQRTVEIGTRRALGAMTRNLLALVMGDGLKMGIYGVAIGAVVAIAASWILVRTFNIHDLGFMPFVSSTAVVASIAMIASFFPAWRATLVSPMAAIRDNPESLWQSARQSIRKLVSGPTAESALSDGTLLTEFADASRRSDSFAEALRTSLETLRVRIGAESVALLENPAEHKFLLNRLKFYPFPLPLTSGDFDTWLRWAKEAKPEYVAEIEALRNTGAHLAVPLRTKKDILGVLLLGKPIDREEYSPGEKQVLRQCAQQLALMIENARLTDRIVEQEKLRRDLALAAEVQQRLLPAKPPEVSMATLAAVSVPARTVGGDYYDFVDIGDRRIGIALADVAGKGIAAALIMSVVQASLRILSAEGEISLPQLAAKMNGFLYRSTNPNSYATFFYAQIDESSRELRYVNAGHNPPYLVRYLDSIPEIQELAAGGPVIGLLPRMSYQEATVNLQSGDVLVAFTDGVTEAMNQNDEEFGEERLKDLLLKVVSLPVQEISARISAELKTWINNAAQHDDLTFIVMKVK